MENDTTYTPDVNTTFFPDVNEFKPIDTEGDENH